MKHKEQPSRGAKEVDFDDTKRILVEIDNQIGCLLFNINIGGRTSKRIVYIDERATSVENESQYDADEDCISERHDSRDGIRPTKGADMKENQAKPIIDPTT